MSKTPSQRRSPARKTPAPAPAALPSDAVAAEQPATVETAPAQPAQPASKRGSTAKTKAKAPAPAAPATPATPAATVQPTEPSRARKAKAAAELAPADQPPAAGRVKAQDKTRAKATQKTQATAPPVEAVPEAPTPVAAEPAAPARKRPARKKSAPLVEAAPAALVEPAVERGAEPAAEPVVEPAPAKPAESTQESTQQPTPRPTKKPTKKPASQPAGQPTSMGPGRAKPARAEADRRPERAQTGGQAQALVEALVEVPDAPEAPLADAVAPPPPPRFTLGSREEEGVFGDYELHDPLDGATLRLRLLGRQAWRCDCAGYAAQAYCEHGEALQALLDAPARQALAAGWPAREAEVWLLPGARRRLQWVAGQGLEEALRHPPGLDEAASLDAEQAQDWLQQRLIEARAQGVPLRVDAQVWPQLAWARDAQARVQRLERAMREGEGLLPMLQDELPAYQWEAALFAVCAGRTLLADDLGLGQRGAAIAALQLWGRLFAVGPAMIVAAQASHAAWQRDLQRWLGEVPADVVLVTPEQIAAPRLNPALLVVDGLEALEPAQLAALRALQAPQLLLICQREPLGEARLASWVDWLDEARRGPLAQLQALGECASKKQQREALQSVLLSRRRRELEPQLPAALAHPLWLDAAGTHLPLAALKQLRQWMQRWKLLGYLSSAEQQQLLQALTLLPPGSRQVLAAKAEALLQLRRDWLESAVPAAARLLVVARSETLLDSLAAAPQLRRLPPQRLRAGDSAEQRQAALQAWRAAPTGLLLGSDDALATLAEGELGGEGLALVHADLPWQGERPALRLQQACGTAARGVPTALLLVNGSLDAPLWRAQRAGLALPAWLDQPPLWLEPEALAELMAALAAALPDLLSD
jgi:hypothetical protein